MHRDVRDGREEWVEVNIVPASTNNAERLLLDVIDPLVHDRLVGRIDTWFYFWEPDLRLRIRWRNSADAEENRSALFAFLNAAQRAGHIVSWYEGSHGERGKTYPGEADFYGEEMWELTAKDWMSGSELALALMKFDTQNRLTKPESFHWSRRVHLFSNQLLLDEVPLCLRQARGYLSMRDPSDPKIARMTAAIDEYLGKGNVT